MDDLGTAGGFSGANLWRIEDDGNSYCLRRWPEEQLDHQQRLAWIHGVLRQARHAGCSFLAVPLENSHQATLTIYEGSLWQLEPWMPGHASYWSQPEAGKLCSAMQALARFHLAARSDARSARISPGIMTRRERLARLWENGAVTECFLRIESASQHDLTAPALRPIAVPICNLFRLLASEISRQLNWAVSVPVEIQPIIGDIWHDHVLFDANGQVSGIVDFGAMREDTPLADVARLAGSLAADDSNQWDAALRAWSAAHPAANLDRELCHVFDRSTTVISGLNWLEWICVENRDFGSLVPVMDRLRQIVRRMDFLASSL